MHLFLIIGIGLVIFGVSQVADAPSSFFRLFSLPDIDPKDQGGNWKRDYDFIFWEWANKTGVPFGLLKAHAIMESSLNPKAYRNENPTNRADRQGWASRGLMQLLYWPGSTRWEKFGYSAKALGDGDLLYDSDVNIELGAKLIKENLNTCKGNVRDAINMYNTGKKEAQYQAPHKYVDKVLGYYETLTGKDIA